MSVVTRFAPSPTGDLHLGHAFSALFARDVAARSNGRFLVRIEDIDRGRCRDHFIERNLEDLAWLGVKPDEPPVRQSQRGALYAEALDHLAKLGVLYPCFCTRKEIQAEVREAAAAPHLGPVATSAVYPGRCRRLAPAEREKRLAAGRPHALRLDIGKVVGITGELTWTDRARGRQTARIERFGDVVLARKELATSYHLAVVVDDAAQGVTAVTRGEDLFEATHVHRTLYALLGFAQPVWHHHPLCRDSEGRRLSKRAGDLTIRDLRERGLSPEDVRRRAETSLV